MTAWQRLIQNSSLSSGTAWQHLLAQNSGTGAGTTVVRISDIILAMPSSDLDIDASVNELLLMPEPGAALSVTDSSVACSIKNNGVIVHV